MVVMRNFMEGNSRDPNELRIRNPLQPFDTLQHRGSLSSSDSLFGFIAVRS